MKLLIGLGNPGDRYQYTRHNVGFRAVDALSDGAWKNIKRCQSLVAETTILGEDILLAKPQTFMNNSGTATDALVRYYDIALEDVIIVHDDLDLMVGDVRLRPGGSPGGHNGVESILVSLKTRDIARMRIGIAETEPGKQRVPSEAYVLKPFSAKARAIITHVLDNIPSITNDWLKGASTHTYHTQPGPA